MILALVMDPSRRCLSSINLQGWVHVMHRTALARFLFGTALAAAICGCGGQQADSPDAALRKAPQSERVVQASRGASGTLDKADDPSAIPEMKQQVLEAAGQRDVQPVAADPAPPVGEPLASASLSREKRAPFAGWPTPDVVLVATGRQNGYIEPCGCSGLANAKGGLARRHTLIRQMRDRGWTVVPVDVGNQVRRFGRQPEIKFQAAAEGLRTMGYEAIGLGPDDLRLSVGELIASVAATGEGQTPFLSANMAILDWSFMPRYQIVDAGGKKIAITAVLGESMQREISSDEILRKPAAEAIDEIWPEMDAAQADLYVLLAHANLEETEELARRFPQFDVVITAGGADEPPLGPDAIEGSDATVVQTGSKGMYISVIGLFSDGDQRIRFERVPLDASYDDSADMLSLMASYQNQLKQAGLKGLGLDPVGHPSGRTFVGAERCSECHTTAYGIWSSTPHAHALDSLVHPSERVTLPRHHDPECISCHVTGWNPQQYFPYTSGYLDLDTTAHLQGNGCENCHGPGSAHVAAESGEIDLPEDEIQKLRDQMRLPLAEAEKTCVQCHDMDNSPAFHVRGAFEEYWEQIKHYE